ncbi:HesA/MoeB/ThiF family protein [Sphingopyxis sp. H115]|jgi:hypothetical protein|uniref:HesA/MoeB/ThiF family protein n=1 Tax=Sphingopyxis sp. H115 TaxID=1759073 RepID=UPI0009EC99BD|nr:ThiF family adenylyltransferase [Sphingopyxis sp. H115]MDZ4369277.1 ThiF family adenylyltransferase [Afipia sp.]
MTRSTRQNFLGADSDEKLRSVTVGLVGLGGGNSHVVQQLSHVGIGRLVCVDDDIVEDSNLNRLIGGRSADLDPALHKTSIAERMVRGLVEGAEAVFLPCRWEAAREELARCDIIVGGLDSYRARSELEGFCRRLMIPYIDMGMDVHDVGDGFAIGGQTILSMPGGPCLWCMGMLSEPRLAEEAQRYGAAGGKPQVVWPNGVLASLAVGLVVQLVTPWTKAPLASAYLEYDGNRQQVATSNRLKAIAGQPCTHYPANDVGDPLFDVRLMIARTEPPAAAVPADRPADGFWTWLRAWFSRRPA